MRLAKHLAHAGIASRRAAETLIRAGRVAVDGEIVRDPARDVGPGDRVELDGRALPAPAANVVYALNKPLGVVSTARDTHGRPTVVGLVHAPGLRLYPVGRLDIDTSGLILLTNDGELAERLTHPRYEVPKTYRACVGAGLVSDREMRALRSGIQLDEGVTAPARARRLRGPHAASGRARGETIELTIREGRNRQVRRMLDAIGHPVLELERVAFGPVRLGDLAPGAHRRLSDAEVSRLRASVGPPREHAERPPKGASRGASKGAFQGS